ncbi:glyceraldehyde-3-phosphate dehydrogenase 2-like [Agrilus planipennis]|uniref:glyceraldehyde-3-phosphate dehydrogenase (phosphorylating) n=1 Tax=Agrilus planipennis TaxID=224129 RepID=A0A1W4WQP4_AGRPL|nr:glyceraldehyde-3-phosphate dehydrogenase 2-like [Agrilus planipennis]
MVNIGINGFGRIGRHVLRACIRKGLKVVAINDPYLKPGHMAYLFKFDSVHGRWEGEVKCMDCFLVIDEQKLFVTSEKNPSKIPWAQLGVEYVVEATGVFTSCEKASMHIDGGARRVIITAPSSVPTFVVGVNHDKYDTDMDVISTASSTTNCLAPLIKVMHENFEISDGLMSAIHAMTPNQTIVDGPTGKRWRDGRGGLQNIVPTSTGAAISIGQVFPDLQGKVTGMAMKVPVADVSVVDLTVRLKNNAPYDEIMCKIKEACDGYLKGIMGYTDHQVVSSDFIGDTRSCIVDCRAGIPLNSNFVKMVAWYDNEYGYACRISDMLDYMSSREACPC